MSMFVRYFDITRQNKLIKQDFLNRVSDILDSGEISMGKLCREFEEKYAEINKVKFCLLLSSGTDALTLTVDALDINGPVLTPAISFVATPNSILLNRKQVIFCETDCDANIDITHALSKVSCQNVINPIKAILAVGMYGNPPDIINLKKISDSYGIPLIYDGAQTHLSTVQDKYLSSYCDVAIESYYITKNIGAFTEAGAILTNNKDIYERIKKLRNHGRGASNYEFDEIGYNCRPSEITAASLLCKLQYIHEWTRRRIDIAAQYNKLLSPLIESGKIRTLRPHDNAKCIYHLFPIFVQNRDLVRKKLLELGVETQCQYPIALHKQKSFEHLNQGPFEIAENVCDSVITIPLYPEMLDEEISYVAEKLIEILK